MKHIVEKLIKLKQEHPDSFFRALLTIFTKKTELFKASIQFTIYKKNLNSEQKDRIKNWKWYLYFYRKYSKFLKKLSFIDFPIDTQIPKIIYWCWLQGEVNAPELCKACLNSLRNNMPDYKIIIVTKENIWNLVSIPEIIRKKYEKGFITNTHFSDIIRTYLLAEKGGIWIDSTVLCTGSFPKEILSNNFFVFQNFNRGDEAIFSSSWFIASCKNHPILLYMEELLLTYWAEYNYLSHYYLFHLFFTIVCNCFPDFINNIPRYSNIPPHILQYELFDKFDSERYEEIKLMSSFHKLTWKNEKNIDISDTFFEHILNEYL